MRNILIAFFILCFFSSCVEKSKLETKTIEKKEAKTINKQVEKNQTTPKKKTDSESLKTNIKSKQTNDKCAEINIGDKLVLKNHTFAFDFEPFNGSCFVTAYDPEYADPPSALEIALYKDGKKIYTFDSRFNPNSVNCRIDAVSFKDLNKDDLQDVIIVGKCAAKSGEILANEVFMNTGKKTFKTETPANDKLENFKTIEEITDFVKKNEDLFFK